MLGSYVLLVPLAIWLWSQLAPRRTEVGWVTALVGGLAYLGLGAAGASILAAVWPALIQEYAEAGSDHAAIRGMLVTATRIAEDGLQGALQNIAGGVWWTAVGLRLLALRHRKLAALTLVLGAASTVNALGSLLTVNVLSLTGLTLTVLLAPVWSVCLGVSLVRAASRARRHSAQGRLPAPGRPGRRPTPSPNPPQCGGERAGTTARWRVARAAHRSRASPAGSWRAVCAQHRRRGIPRSRCRPRARRRSRPGPDRAAARECSVARPTCDTSHGQAARLNRTVGVGGAVTDGDHGP